jgi:hypothetical protein
MYFQLLQFVLLLLSLWKPYHYRIWKTSRDFRQLDLITSSGKRVRAKRGRHKWMGSSKRCYVRMGAHSVLEILFSLLGTRR